LSIFFKLEKPPVQHLEGFILLPKEGGDLNFKIFFFGFFFGTLEVTTLVWWKTEIGYCYDVVIDQKLSPK
jgi:hypothetical protein